MNNVYIPITINQLIRRMQEMINDSNGEIDGNECIIDMHVYSEDTDEAPPGSIELFIEKSMNISGKAGYGTVIFTPEKSKILM